MISITIIISILITTLVSIILITTLISIILIITITIILNYYYSPVGPHKDIEEEEDSEEDTGIQEGGEESALLPLLAWSVIDV